MFYGLVRSSLGRISFMHIHPCRSIKLAGADFFYRHLLRILCAQRSFIVLLRQAAVEAIDAQRGKVNKNGPYDILIDGRCV